VARFRLLPRDERFFELFEEATTIIVEGASQLHQMLGDFDHAEQYREAIHNLEHAGDAVIHKVVDKLNRTFVTPLDPEDIRAIASRLDDVIDYTQAAAERLVLYDVGVPLPACRELAGALVTVVKEVQAVILLLRDFSQRKEIMLHCIEINRIENVGDKIYREALGILFRKGDPMELMRWKEIFEQIEQAIDECEDLADVIESIVVKHA
jgi:uncharacterized protein Yka (UPF0111/DUF47 family)